MTNIDKEIKDYENYEQSKKAELYNKFKVDDNSLLPFSASRLKSLKNNKAKFFLDYVLGYPRGFSHAMERGSAVEFGVDQFLLKRCSLEDCVASAKTYYKSATNFLDDAEEDKKQYEMIEPMVTQVWHLFVEGYDFTDKDFVGNQLTVNTFINGVPFTGFVDYVFENEDTIFVIDLKTKDKFMLTYDDKLQMAIYKKAFQEKSNKNIHCSFLLTTGKVPKKKNQKVCDFIPFQNEYDFIGEAELQLKSLEHMLKLANDIDDLKVLFAPKLDDWIWNKDKDAKKNRQEVWGI